MPWHDITLLESLRNLQGAVDQPTNPSSFVLAFVGVVTFLCYQHLARPGRGGRSSIDQARPIVKPRATSAEAEAPREDRRVA